MTEDEKETVAALVNEAVADAVNQERERCAQVAEGFALASQGDSGPLPMIRKVANRIAEVIREGTS